jgi:hypothetical protein
MMLWSNHTSCLMEKTPVLHLNSSIAPKLLVALKARRTEMHGVSSAMSQERSTADAGKNSKLLTPPNPDVLPAA